MVVPDCDHSVSAELLQGLGIIGMLRYEVDVGFDTNIKQLVQCFLIALCVVCEVFRMYNLCNHTNPFNATVKIIRMTKVVEGHSRIVVNISVDQA